MSEPDNIYADQVLIAIRKIIRAIDLHSRSLLQKFGMTSPQLVVLSEVARREKVAITEIARHVSLSQGTVTTIIDRLEKRGLVTRKRGSDDRRKTEVSATEEGLRLIASRPSLLHEQFIEQFGRLEEWEQHLILSSLQRVGVMMEGGKGVKDSAPMLTSGPLSASPEETKAFLEDEEEPKTKE